jgi:hypothetical protein
MAAYTIDLSLPFSSEEEKMSMPLSCREQSEGVAVNSLADQDTVLCLQIGAGAALALAHCGWWE